METFVTKRACIVRTYQSVVKQYVATESRADGFAAESKAAAAPLESSAA